MYGSMAAGGVSGLLYKSTGMSLSLGLPLSHLKCRILFLAGVRPALAAATLMSGAAGVWSLVKKTV